MLTDEKRPRTHHFQQVDVVQESAALALRVGELHRRNELRCQERGAKCLIAELYSVLELRDALARKQNFVEDASYGQREAHLQGILEEREFRLVRIVAQCQTSSIPTISSLVVQ